MNEHPEQRKHAKDGTVVEYRERINGRLGPDAPYKVGHLVRLNDGEAEWNADLFYVTIQGGTVSVFTTPGYGAPAWAGGLRPVAALGPAAWLKYERKDYEK